MVESGTFEILTFVVTAIILVVTIITLRDQIQKQTKTSSANLATIFLARLRDEDFRDLWEKIRNPNVTEYNRLDVARLLNHFEYIAIFEEDKILELDHVVHMFGANLKAIKNDPFIKNIIDGKSNENSKFYYSKLIELLKKIENYNI